MPLFSQQGYQAFRRTVKTEITSSRNFTTIVEGGTATFTVNTKNIRSGTRLYYTLSGIDQADLSQGSITGFVDVQSGQAVITVTLANDLSWQEGVETITPILRRDTPDGPAVVGPGITVLDTSRVATGQAQVGRNLAGPGLASSGGTFTFTVPQGVTSISVLCVGAGGDGSSYPQYSSSLRRTVYYAGAGGGGGGLAWKNNIPVTPGEVLVIYRSINSGTWTLGESSLRRSNNLILCRATAGGNALLNTGGSRGSWTHGDWGYSGGVGGSAGSFSTRGGGGGGGAAGYAGQGGAGGGGGVTGASAQPNSGGGGGGSSSSTARPGGGGGGVGLLGLGNTGIGGGAPAPTGLTGGVSGGGGGSLTFSGDGNGGENGGYGDGLRAGGGGQYGGGGGGGTGGGTATNRPQAFGALGAVRIIWPGDRRQFPSTYTQNLDFFPAL